VKTRQIQEADFILPRDLMSIVVSYYGKEDEPKLELEQERYKTTAFTLIELPMILTIDDIRIKYRNTDERLLPAIVFGVPVGILMTILGASLATIAVPIAALMDHYHPKPKIEKNQKKMQQYKDKTSLFKPFRHHNVGKHLVTKEKTSKKF
jgi:hypothetical protein